MALARTLASCSARLARSFGVSLSRLAKMPSRSSYSLMSFAAVFSPTPGTPGRLSDGSPRSAAYCGYFVGCTPVRVTMPGLVVERVVRHATLVVEHPDVRVLDELVGVAVAGDDDDVVPLVATRRGQRRQDVVGLEAGRFEQRDPERSPPLGGRGPSAGAGCRAPPHARLVVVDHRVAERRLWQVERHRQPIGLVLAQHVDDHRREPVDGVRHLPGGRRQVGWQREEGAVGQRVAVEQEVAGHRDPRST